MQINDENKALNVLDDNIRRSTAEHRDAQELIHSRAQRIMNRQVLRDRLAKCEVQAKLVARISAGESLTTWRMASPPTNDQMLTFGLVQPHENGQYICNGCYNVTHAEWTHNSTEVIRQYTSMDFVTMSRCLLREGSQVWLLVDEETVRDLSMIGLSVVDNSDLLSKVLADETTGMLSAFYVLGGSESDTHVFDARVRVLVKVKDNPCRLLRVRLFDDCGNPRVAMLTDQSVLFTELHVKPSQHSEPVEALIIED